MAEIAHAFAEQNSNQTTASTTYVDIPGAAIASGSFTAGKKYLLLATAQIGEVAAGAISIQAVHGATAFAESGGIYNIGVSDAARRGTWGWFTVWEAVSAEGVKLQFKVDAGDGNVQFAFLGAINLSDDVVENTDWFFAERATDDALTASFLDGAGITLTPGEASNWLVLAYAQLDHTSATDYAHTRLERSGEAASSTPSASARSNATGTQFLHTLARVFALGVAANTFKERSRSDATTHIRLHSAIFALNLNRFRAHAFAYADGGVNLNTASYGDQIQTAGLTPDLTGDALILASWIFDQNDGSAEPSFRVQLDNVDQPAGQTAAAFHFEYGSSAADLSEWPWMLATMTSLAAAPHTVDLDADVDVTTGTPQAQERLLLVLPLELLGGEFVESQPRSSPIIRAGHGLGYGSWARW